MKKPFIIYCLSFIAISFLFAEINPYRAPLYWNPYEYHIIKEQNGENNNYIPEAEFQKNIDMVNGHLKEQGYNMICMDGWGDVSQLSPHGYRKSHSQYWSHDFAWWSNYLNTLDLDMGMYGNPLWIHVNESDTTTKIIGTDIPVSSLIDTDENATWFTWVQVDRPGAEEYIKGYIKYYADMGIHYFRVDFLSWFENGWDRYMGTVGPDRPRSHYETALQWMREAADSNGVFLSLVMPHLYFNGAAERQYGHMFRINEDAGEGSWYKWSEKDRGIKRNGWSAYANPFDGMIYWSQFSGRDSVILDPDFIRLNTFTNDEEKKSVISLCFVAGAAVTVADLHSSIDTDLWLYQNPELLALHEDGFSAKPLSYDPTNENSQIWIGQMQDNAWIIALFNRENTPQNRSVNFLDVGIQDIMQVRDLWQHKNLDNASSFSARIPAHGCRVLKVVTEAHQLDGPDAMFVKAMQTSVTTAGVATVHLDISDPDNNPIEGAEVFVYLDSPYNEMLTGTSNDDGRAEIMSAQNFTGVRNVRTSVFALYHDDHSYSADMNFISSSGKTYYVGGTFSDWSLLEMDYVNGWWQIDSLVIREGAQELKFADTHDFTGDDWGNANGLSGVAQLSTGGAPNINFTIDRGSFYTIQFNESTLEYRISQDTVSHIEDAMFVAGTYNNWRLQEMSFNGRDWVLENIGLASGAYELKFANTADFSDQDWGNANGISGYAQNSTGGDPNVSFNISTSGHYDIYFNDITLKYSIETRSAITGSKPVISIYPNPTVDHIMINPGNQKLSLNLYNIRGQKIKSYTVKHNCQIDLTAYPAGYYLLQTVDVYGDVKVFKLVKK